jgi:hypothetical protein
MAPGFCRVRTHRNLLLSKSFRKQGCEECGIAIILLFFFSLLLFSIREEENLAQFALFSCNRIFHNDLRQCELLAKHALHGTLAPAADDKGNSQLLVTNV